jgi:integrase
MGLGPLHALNLADARDAARDRRKLLVGGIDPIDARDERVGAERIAAARSKSFKDCAEAYIGAHRASWRNDKHAAQWESTLEAYAYPSLGSLPASSIDTALVLKVLEPIWQTKSETASRLRGRIEKILDWATVRGFREGLNPARWRGHLDHTLPRRSKVAAVEHHPALPFAEAPAFVRELRKQEGVAARALEFTILAAARTAETIGATWPELSPRGDLWTVPANRMKGNREHRVPLSARAADIAREMKQLGGDSYFRCARAGLSNMAMLKVFGAHEGRSAHGARLS